jgi:hypothetical protein
MAELDERIAREVRATYRDTPPLDASARARLMERLASEPPPRRGGAWSAWIPRHATLRIAPLAAAGAAFGILVAGVFAGWGVRGMLERADHATAPGTTAAVAAGGARRVVEFVLVAPGASRVALVGDFNEWDIAATPMDRARSGDTWTVSIPLTSGRHVYAFVVDGTRWLADPVAPLAPEDGFGLKNSVVVVGGAGST